MSDGFETILDDCIDRMLGGATLEQVLAAHPDHAAELAPLLTSTNVMFEPGVPAAPVGARLNAMQTMMSQLDRAPEPRGIGGWFADMRARSGARRGVALAGAAMLFGALAVGASAATGAGPEPVRSLFGIQSSSNAEIEFSGVITSIEGDSLVIAVEGGQREVLVRPDTKITDGGDVIPFDTLIAGDEVEVHATVQLDNTLVATRVHREDHGEQPPVTPDDENAPPPPAGGATPDDSCEHVDNSGPGNCEDANDNDGSDEQDDEADDQDDGGQCDSTGPGNCADDDRECDDSGAGNCDDEDHECDNSGPGNCEDEGAGDDQDEPADNATPPASMDDDAGDDHGGDAGDADGGGGSGDDGSDSGHGGGETDQGGGEGED